MPMREEAERAIEWLRRLVEADGAARLDHRYIHELRAFHLSFRNNGKTIDTTASGEFLSALLSTQAYRDEATAYVSGMIKRLRNPRPESFFCRSGVPAAISVKWPLTAISLRAASFVHFSVSDHRERAPESFGSVIVTTAQELFDLKGDKFRRHKLIVNTIRAAIDESGEPFSVDGNSLPEFVLRLEPNKSSPDALEPFILGAVYWLGFKQGDRSTAIWIADDWDAAYLGVDRAAMKRTAQILAARELVVLDSSGEFASAGDAMLKRANDFEITGASDPRQSAKNYDVFICHASEDKNSFVTGLAEALTRAGLRVWYDDSTMKLGDRLRHSIDEGLKSSRFGVVILSKAFFAKQWPQWELDGLFAIEERGRKVVLPIWHGVTKEDVANFSPLLVGRFAAKTETGTEDVVQQILEVVRG